MATTTQANPARKPKPLALIYKDYCTGCEACISLCPIKDCIVRHGDSPDQSHCQVVPQKCIGCTLCVQICPWDCIEMIPPDAYPPAPFSGAPGDVKKQSPAAA